MEANMITNILEKEGYSVLDNVVRFLQEFWDLTIYFENKRSGLKDDDISFLFEKATHWVAPERVRDDYSVRVGGELCLIGAAYRDYFVLMMSNDGSIYGAYENYLCKIGDSGYGAIEAIIFDYDFIEIP